MTHIRLASAPLSKTWGMTRFNRVDPLGLLNWLAMIGYLCLFYGFGRLVVMLRIWLIRL